jgi:hypothetical protein
MKERGVGVSSIQEVGLNDISTVEASSTNRMGKASVSRECLCRRQCRPQAYCDFRDGTIGHSGLLYFPGIREGRASAKC